MFLSRLANHLPNDSSSGRHTREWILGGKIGTAQTIRRMRDLVSEGKRDFRVRKVATQLCQQCRSKDYSCYARSIFEFCRDKIQYVFDPSGVELLESPYKILEAGAADCDSIVMLLAAMLESVGFPCEFVTIKADVKRPDDYSHVFLRCKVTKVGWVDMDATMPNQPFGWGPPASYPRTFWPASNDQAENHEGDKMAGLGQIPHLEYAKGQVPGGIWNFRNEAASVTTTPEELEMQPLKGQKSELPTMPGQSFFTADQGREVFSVPPVFSKAFAAPPGPAEVVAVTDAEKRKAALTYAVIGLVGLWFISKL